jgi:hypothetical protein
LAIPNRKKRQNPLSVPLDAKAVISHLREQGASAQTSGWHARLVRIVLKGTQDLPQQLLSALHGFIAAKARDFEMLILKYFNLNSFRDQSHIQS